MWNQWTLSKQYMYSRIILYRCTQKLDMALIINYQLKY